LYAIILDTTRLIKRIKPYDINTCCERSIENPQRACNSLSHHKGNTNALLKKNTVVIVLISSEGHRQRLYTIDLMGYNKYSTIMSILS
jgi:hypothetical protein